MTPEEQQQVDQIERDRRRREAALLAILLLVIGGAAEFAGTTRRNRRSVLSVAGHAIALGHDPVQAIRRVIYGDAGLHLPGLRGIVTRAMEDAWVNGYQRAFILAKQPLPEAKDIPIYEGAPRPPDEATETPLPIYVHGPSRFAAAAGTLLDRLYASLGRLIEQAVAEALTAGMTTMQVVAAVRQAFIRYGWTRTEPQVVNPESKGSPGFAAAALATSAILDAWNAGYWGGLNSPAVMVKLTAFTHHTVMDGNETDICHERNGLTLPPNDTYWLHGWPSLHRGCRSVISGHFEPVDMSDWLPEIPPAPGFGAAPAEAFGFRF